MLSRSELEELGKDELAERAERAGVPRARFLTKPELVDELILASAREQGSSQAHLKKQRGLFGIARDLIFGALERGLNLPDAAERFRSAPPPPPFRAATPAVATVTLAQIYLAQGHTSKATEVLHRVLELEPDDAEAARMLGELRDTSFVAPKPPVFDREEDALELFDEEEDDDSRAEVSVPPESGEVESSAPRVPEPISENPIPRGTLEPSPTFRSPGQTAKPKPPRTETTCHALVTGDGLRVSWSVDSDTCAHYMNRYPGGRLVVRSVAITPHVTGPLRGIDDRDVDREGEVTVTRPARAVMRVSVGWKFGDDFRAIAQG